MGIDMSYEIDANNWGDNFSPYHTMDIEMS
jgi:hypothetical protein